MSSGRVRFVGTGGDALLLAGAGLVLGAGLWVWLTGQIAGLLFGPAWIGVGIEDLFSAVFALPANISDPANAWPETARAHLPGPVGFAIAALLAGVLIAVVIVSGVKLLGRFGAGRRGMASAAELDRKLSAAAALKKSRRLRPTLDGKPTTAHVAVDLGKAAGLGQRVMADIENSVLLLAAPRQGKTSQVVIPWLAHWQGPALATSVRPDIVEATYTLREQLGPVSVLDVSDTTWPDPLKWSPVIGCEDYDKARRRAKVMVTVGKGGADSTNAGFFAANAVNLLAGWLHAAALDGATIENVMTWALDDHNSEPVRILKTHTTAAPGVAGNLASLYSTADETRTSLFATVQTAVTPLLSHRARQVFCPGPSEHLDIESFLRDSGTVYLLVPETKASEMAPLLSAFVDEVTECATAIAATTPTGRLDPPLLMSLDEVANVVPLENLPSLMSYSAGSGILVVAILQEIAAARFRWGHDGADMLWGAATVKIALGGLAGDEADWFAALAGTWREDLLGTRYGTDGISHAPTDRERDVIKPNEVRALDPDKGEALVVAGAASPIKTRMTRHYRSADANRYRESASALRRRMSPGAAVDDAAEQNGPPRWWERLAPERKE